MVVALSCTGYESWSETLAYCLNPVALAVLAFLVSFAVVMVFVALDQACRAVQERLQRKGGGKP